MKKMTIDELKIVQMDILQFVHNFCNERNIRYSVSGGTAIGAIRHKGYIPWDDDIDIFMLRSEYDRLVSEFNDPTGRYILHALETDGIYELPFAKIEDARTLLVERTHRKQMGVNIDIFPCDNMADTYKESIGIVKKVNRYRFLAFAKMVEPTANNSLIKKIGIVGLHLLLSPFSLRHLSKITSDIAKKSGKINSKYVAVTVWGYGIKEIIERKDFDAYKLVDFEDRQFYILADYDNYLRTVFGNYMQLPPESKRQSPHTIDNVYWK